MVYHCKFGEFGVLEGQFTEPSGVAVNAQNDIVVADTNNHRYDGEKYLDSSKSLFSRGFFLITLYVMCIFLFYS